MGEFVKLYTVKSCSIIILAAGTSSRLGSPKQLLTHKNKTLLQHSIDVAKQMAMPVILVLGANMNKLLSEIDISGIHVSENPNWAKGISSSIGAGLESLKSFAPTSDAAIFMICDQPFIDTKLLKSLLFKQKELDIPIVASNYGNTIGIPSLFHHSFFQKLRQLKGDTGAKKLMLENPDLFATIPFPLGIIDIDTPEDYKKLRSRD